MKTIVISGKGGIGKSTIVTNLAVLLQQRGLRVLQVGCDPKHDSCSRHFEKKIPNLMDTMVERSRLDPADFDRMISVGRTGVHCLEIGGPKPGIGCAGRAVSLMIDFMDEIESFATGYDIRIFDLLGDVVCGGFAAPIRTGENTEIYLVASGELLPLYAANNIARGIVNLSRRGGGRVAGVIANLRDTPGEQALIRFFAQALGTTVAGTIPRHEDIFFAEMAQRTVAEQSPESEVTVAFNALADFVMGDKELVVPTPLEDDDLQSRCQSHLLGARDR